MPVASIKKGKCPVMGYEMQSLQCANCRYNRVEDLVRFAACQRTECKTLGTVCVATDADTQPAEMVTQNPLPKVTQNPLPLQGKAPITQNKEHAHTGAANNKGVYNKHYD